MYSFHWLRSVLPFARYRVFSCVNCKVWNHRPSYVARMRCTTSVPVDGGVYIGRDDPMAAQPVAANSSPPVTKR